MPQGCEPVRATETVASASAQMAAVPEMVAVGSGFTATVALSFIILWQSVVPLIALTVYSPAVVKFSPKEISNPVPGAAEPTGVAPRKS